MASPYARAMRWMCLGLSGLVVAGALVSLMGWVLDYPRLADWDSDGLTIQPNTTLAALAGAIAVTLLALGWRKTAAAVGSLSGLIGAAALFQHVSAMDLGIDELLLFERTWGYGSTTVRGRMGLPASLSFTLLGIGTILGAFGPRIRRAAPVFGLMVTGIATLSLIGYLFGADALFKLPQFTAIALQTSMMLFALGLALIMAVPEHDPVRMLSEDSAAGLLARESLPIIIVLPVVLAYMLLWGERANLYDKAMGAAILVLLLTVLLLALLWRGASAVRVREEALKNADRHKDEFLATLAHELRNPLAPISNALAILKHGKAESQAFERTREMMERQVNHMVRLIDDLLDVNRISSGKLALRLQSVDVAALLPQIVESCRLMADRRGLELKAAIAPGSLQVNADPVRLAQVVGNLLNNACKFTNPGGHIRVTAGRKGSDIVIAVSDDGIGVPTDKLQSIFGLFAQVDGTREQSHGGLGLGLTLAKRMVELHGGTIHASSDGPGTGSTFTVRLPAAQGMVDAQAVPEVKNVAANRRRILVVDDNRDNADSLALLLRMKGHDTHEAHDGEEAVAAAAKLQPDAVLLDIGLPKLNGYEACRRIRQEQAGRKLAIYALTGWAQEADRRKSAEAGFDGHLVKPVDPDVLTKLLAAL